MPVTKVIFLAVIPYAISVSAHCSGSSCMDETDATSLVQMQSTVKHRTDPGSDRNGAMEAGKRQLLAAIPSTSSERLDEGGAEERRGGRGKKRGGGSKGRSRGKVRGKNGGGGKSTSTPEKGTKGNPCKNVNECCPRCQKMEEYGKCEGLLCPDPSEVKGMCKEFFCQDWEYCGPRLEGAIGNVATGTHCCGWDVEAAGIVCALAIDPEEEKFQKEIKKGKEEREKLKQPWQPKTSVVKECGGEPCAISHKTSNPACGDKKNRDVGKHSAEWTGESCNIAGATGFGAGCSGNPETVECVFNSAATPGESGSHSERGTPMEMQLPHHLYLCKCKQGYCASATANEPLCVPDMIEAPNPTWTHCSTSTIFSGHEMNMCCVERRPGQDECMATQDSKPQDAYQDEDEDWSSW